MPPVAACSFRCLPPGDDPRRPSVKRTRKAYEPFVHRDARLPQGGPVTVHPAKGVGGVRRAGDDRDPAVPQIEQMAGRAHRGVPRRRCHPAERPDRRPRPRPPRGEGQGLALTGGSVSQTVRPTGGRAERDDVVRGGFILAGGLPEDEDGGGTGPSARSRGRHDSVVPWRGRRAITDFAAAGSRRSLWNSTTASPTTDLPSEPSIPAASRSSAMSVKDVVSASGYRDPGQLAALLHLRYPVRDPGAS